DAGPGRPGGPRAEPRRGDDPDRRDASGARAPGRARPPAARRRPLWRSAGWSPARPPRAPRRAHDAPAPSGRAAAHPERTPPGRLGPRGVGLRDGGARREPHGERDAAAHRSRRDAPSARYAAAALPPPLPPRGSFALEQALPRLFRLF